MIFYNIFMSMCVGVIKKNERERERTIFEFYELFIHIYLPIMYK